MSLAVAVRPNTQAPAAQPEPRKVPNFLRAERALLERFMPGLDAALKVVPLNVLEIGRAHV